MDEPQDFSRASGKLTNFVCLPIAGGWGRESHPVQQGVGGLIPPGINFGQVPHRGSASAQSSGHKVYIILLIGPWMIMGIPMISHGYDHHDNRDGHLIFEIMSYPCMVRPYDCAVMPYT